MPNENIMIGLGNYPELKDLAEGDSGKLVIDYVVKSNDGENLEIETQAIENQDDESKRFHRDMSRQENMMGAYDEEEED